MEEKAIKRRNWVKNIAIIFLSVMLVLTLFSNTIMNYSLPEVSAQYVYSGNITTRIRGSGTVEAKEVYNVTAPSSSKIKDIGIKVGQRVEIGDVMFLLENAKDVNLIAALEALAQLKEDYNATMATLGGDYLDLQLAVTEAQTALAEARSKRAAADKAKNQLANVTEQYKAEVKLYEQLANQKTKIDNKIITLEAIEGIEEANASLNTAKLEAEKLKAALDQAKAAKKEAETALEKAKDNAERKAEQYNDAKEALDVFIEANSGTSVDEAALTAMIREISDLERKYAYDVEDYQKTQVDFNNSLQSLYLAWQTAVSEYNNALQNGASEEELVPLRNACVSAEQAYNSAANNIPEDLRTMQRALETAAINLDRKREDLRIMQEKYNQSQDYLGMLQMYKDAVDKAETDKKTADKAVTGAEKALTDTDKAITKAETAYDDAKKLVELLSDADSLKALKAESASLETQMTKTETQKTNLSEQQSELNAKIAETVSDSALKSMENNLTKAQNTLAAEMEKNKGKTEVVQMKLDIITQKINEKESEIAKIESGDFTSEVKAPISGVISTVNVQTGQDIQLNDPITEIQLVDKGFSISFSVTTEQAKRIKAGDQAKIEYWWGDGISAIVESIKTDTTNPAQKKIVTLSISGDIQPGTQLTFTIGENSQFYDSVIPNTAIREDNAGKFVLIVEAKNTPLGNRYTARRIDIQVITSDETSTAVSGITYGDFVITASSQPVTAGTQVRLIES